MTDPRALQSGHMAAHPLAGGEKARYLTLAAILLLAFALRVAGLDRLPLWWDEGNSIYFGTISPAQVVRETRLTNDTDPPAYRLSLGVWAAVAGYSPFAVRFLSVALAMITMALTWRMGAWLLGPGGAALATLLLALSPMQIYYAREAKGYTFVLAFGLLATYAWGKKLGYLRRDGQEAVGRRALAWWAVYVFSTAAAISAHYYAGGMVLWQGLWVVGQSWRALARGNAEARAKAVSYLIRWGAAMGMVGLLLLPWVWIVFSSTVSGVTGLSPEAGRSLWGYLAEVAMEFGSLPEAGDELGLAVSGLALTLGLAGALLSRPGRILASWFAVPLGAAFVVQQVYPFFSPRFLLYLGPPLYLLVAGGSLALAKRKWGLAAMGMLSLLIALRVPSLQRIYARPVDIQEDPRPAVARIREMAHPGDALVYVYIWQAAYLQSYYPDHELTLYRAHYTPESAARELQEILDRHRRVWLLNYRVAAENPDVPAAAWLETETYKLESAWYGNHHLALYLRPEAGQAMAPSGGGKAVFAGEIALTYPAPSEQLVPGEALALPLRWQALSDIQESYAVFMHVGPPGAPPLAQNDGPPLNGLAPTHTWKAGQEILDRRGVLLPKDMPAGRYRVTVGLYRISDGSRLPLENGRESLSIGYVNVMRGAKKIP